MKRIVPASLVSLSQKAFPRIMSRRESLLEAAADILCDILRTINDCVQSSGTKSRKTYVNYLSEDTLSTMKKICLPFVAVFF